MRQVIMLATVGLLIGPAARLLSDEKNPAQKATAEWLYPGAKVIHSGHGGAVTCVVQETADDVAKVLKHYGDTFGIKLQESAAIQTGAGPRDVAYVHVGRKAAGGTATVSTFQTKTAVATLIISRSQVDKVTTITITHVPMGMTN